MSVERDVTETTVAAGQAQRLCNEIQLFDLCDRERCAFKEGKFCTNAEMLTAFERISDAEVLRSEVYVSDDLEEGEDGCDGEYDDGIDDGEFDEEADPEEY